MSELLVSPSYVLSKQPAGTVLVNKHTGEIYKQQEVFEAYPSWGHDTAANHLKRMLKVKPDLVDHDLVKSFFNFLIGSLLAQNSFSFSDLSSSGSANE